MLSDSMQPVKSGTRFVRTLGLPYAPAAVAGGFGAALARARARTRAGVVRFERFGPATNGDSLVHATRGGCTDGAVTAVRQSTTAPERVVSAKGRQSSLYRPHEA